MNRGRLSMVALAYLAAVSIAAIAVAVIRWRSEGDASFVLFVVITGLGMLAHAYPVAGFRHQAYQVTLPFIVIAAATLSGPQLVAFVVLIHLAEQARLRRRLHIQWFNVCDYYLGAATAAAVYHRASLQLPQGALGQVAATLAAGSAFILLNRVLLAGALCWPAGCHRWSPGYSTRSCWPPTWSSHGSPPRCWCSPCRRGPGWCSSPQGRCCWLARPCRGCSPDIRRGGRPRHGRPEVE